MATRNNSAVTGRKGRSRPASERKSEMASRRFHRFKHFERSLLNKIEERKKGFVIDSNGCRSWSF